VIDDDVHICPGVKLAYPVANSGEGSDDQEGTDDAVVNDSLQEGYTLNRLAKSHLISQDAVLSKNTIH